MADLNGAMQKLKITPASIAEAIGLGIDETSLPRAGQKPVSSSKNPETINAPTELLNGKPRAPDEMRSAAPGVLQTILIGILNFVLSTIESKP
ncbi:unannotated protein [freshwater metagenome]|uniref:Unannotated protein n=1 Tax=freshwater metagenome TaxID=449393 RepID=A0A6J6IHP8_9ZZZZ